MKESFVIYPVGRIHQKKETACIEIDGEFAEALSGLSQFSHIYVLYWFHLNDQPEKRKMLTVHPRGNPQNPETGVFATHAPVRPNLIAMSVCKIQSIRDKLILVDQIDALDGTPVIDIKGYFPPNLTSADVTLPDWK